MEKIILNIWYSNKIFYRLVSYILFPISLLYILIFYLFRIFKTEIKIGIPILCVGNINVGGTGKTSTLLEIIKHFKNKEKIYDAEVLESSTFDENIIIKTLIKAGRTIAKPALEVLEMAIDPFTPAQVRVSLMAALAYLIMPFDLFPDFMPLVGFSDDFVALTAVLSIWSKYMTPSIRARAENKLNKLFPFY